MLTDVNCYQASQGNSNGYTGNPQEQQKHILIGALDGKMFHVTFFNERTKVTTSFVKFLWTAEGAGNLAHGGAIATAIDVFEMEKMPNRCKNEKNIKQNFKN